jgi:hypothetical protein
MKKASTPRRVYVHARTSTAHLSYNGLEYGSPAHRDTVIDPSMPVTVREPAYGIGCLLVSQRKPHRKTVRETWYLRGVSK